MRKPSSKAGPLTADEIREDFQRPGATVSNVAARAYIRNGIGRAAVRDILFNQADLPKQ